MSTHPTPAWPRSPVVKPALLKFDTLHCSTDNRVRVATAGRVFFVSIAGDNFTGPFKTFQQAQAYGANVTGAKA